MNSKYIKVEDNQIVFNDVGNKRVRVKLSDITSVSKYKSGRFGMLFTCSWIGLMGLCFAYAYIQDQVKHGYPAINSIIIICILGAFALFGYGLYHFYTIAPKASKLLAIDSKGNPTYRIDCQEENVDSLIDEIDNLRK